MSREQTDFIEISLKISGKVTGISAVIKNHCRVIDILNELNDMDSEYSLMLFNKKLECLFMMDLVELKKLCEYL